MASLLFVACLVCRPYDVACLKQVMDLDRRISIYIDAYLSTHTFCTLHDLEEAIVDKERSNNPNLQSYDDLRMGPLLKHPKASRLLSTVTRLLLIMLVTCNMPRAVSH